MAKKHQWIDLSQYGVFIGSLKMADNSERLALLDVGDKLDPGRLRELGFLPLKGSLRAEKGIYYLSGDQQLRATALAQTIGIERCPVIEVDLEEIEKVFRQQCEAKFERNLSAIMLRSRPLGTNASGHPVLEGAGGRFVRLSPTDAVTEASPRGARLASTAFLRARTDTELRECAKGFLHPVWRGGRADWESLKVFGRAIHDRDATAAELHRLQEAVEAAAYTEFKRRTKAPSEAAFAAAQSLYYGLPAARVRTAQSIHMQQYSTPLPLSVVAQRLLCGRDELEGVLVLEPTIGHGGLLSLLPPGTKLHGVELDQQRVEAVREGVGGGADIRQGDATKFRFKAEFGVTGFDYVIANPPFGSLDKPMAFDKIAMVRRQDHLIALRALQARSDDGRAVFILGADSAQSDGTVKGGSRVLLNYLYDHYEVHGVAEVDGRLYERQGAGYNVRLVVVGSRTEAPAVRQAPEQLEVFTDYQKLWDWSSAVLDRYPSKQSVATIEPVPPPAERTEGAAETVAAPAPEPWRMTAEEWAAAIASLTRGAIRGVRPGDTEAARIGEKDRLKYGVAQWYLDRAKAGDAPAADWLEDAMPVTHRDVIEKALSEGMPVPPRVRVDYPEFDPPVVERKVNEYQAPYQPASKVGRASSMIPINLAGAVYAALNDLETQHGPVDDYVAKKLKYSQDDVQRLFTPEQVDAIGLSIRQVDEGRGFVNVDQTGQGKGRWVAAMLRYAKLTERTPIFLTIQPALFTDIFRDISDIESEEIFRNVFIFNNSVRVIKFGTDDQVLFPATTPADRARALENMEIDPSVDLVLGTYSQFATKNKKGDLLSALSQRGAMMVLDEAHVAAGESNTGLIVGNAVDNAGSVLYSSATPFKGVSNFSIFHKIFPASVDVGSLPETLKRGGESLQEAISANLARDGVLIRREMDFSVLTFDTYVPAPATAERNKDAANRLAEILSRMSFLAGDVQKQVHSINRDLEKAAAKIPEKERQGSRMQASSMNFGSRLYSINRQFLLALKVGDAVDVALKDLQDGRKPVLAVENTGESLLRAVLAKRSGADLRERELEEIEINSDETTAERRAQLKAEIASAMKHAVLDKPPQFRELLELMLERIHSIKIQGRYGEVTYARPDSEEYWDEATATGELIKSFPDMPLAALDIVRHELGRRGFPVAEVSGRTVELCPLDDGRQWRPDFRPKVDAVSAVAGFQRGKYDSIIITRAGSTGISLHATDRFEDSDTRQRNFIVLQKAADIAAYLQWLGRVNRRDQVVAPVITSLESGLPAELRHTMMHNAKLRRLSANVSSNRDNFNLEGQDVDLLNEVGERVALEWLYQNAHIADRLDIDLPDDPTEATGRGQDYPYVNRLLGRLMMLNVPEQEAILKTLSDRFVELLADLEQQGINPFKVDVFEWRAREVRTEELMSGTLRRSTSTFDDPVVIKTLEYERELAPLRGAHVNALAQAGYKAYVKESVLGAGASVMPYIRALRGLEEEHLRSSLPSKLRESEQPARELIAANRDKAQGAARVMDRIDFLLREVSSFKPGAGVEVEDPVTGLRRGIVTKVHFPRDRSEVFMLSKYVMDVAFVGEEHNNPMTLAALFAQERPLSSFAFRSLDLQGKGGDVVQETQRKTLSEFDAVPGGLVTMRAHVLGGNLFRAAELAQQQRLGMAVLYTDEEGNRQRAIRLKSSFTPEEVKRLPIGMTARDVLEYIDAYLDKDHPEFKRRSMYGTLVLYDQGVKEMAKGDGLMLQVLAGGDAFRLTVPGTKSRSGRLLEDGDIVDLGEKSPLSSLRVKLAGNRKFLSADVTRAHLPELLIRLEANRHVSRFYIPSPDHPTLLAVKKRFNDAEVQGRTLTPDF